MDVANNHPADAGRSPGCPCGALNSTNIKVIIMPASRVSRLLPVFLTVQVAVVIAFGVGFARNSSDATLRLKQIGKSRIDYPPLEITRQEPLRITPLYDDHEMISDEDLAAVLRQIQPRFPAQKIKPNYVEHALRVWGIDAEFRDPKVMSGRKMLDFLVNNAQYVASWGTKVSPLLQEEETGVAIRWGKEEGASVHHDHLLACLSEAGVSLNEPVYTPSHREKTINDILQQALRDFRLDERETEWSVLAYGLWLPPAGKWKNNAGREITFDMLVDRLIRGALPLGVCHGTHRLYSLMALVRLDDEFNGQLIRPETRARIMTHLKQVRDIIIDSQFPDGHWASNWPEGADSVKKPVEDELFRQVIATGHHLEWLAIAPEELHPPREKLHLAATWLIKTTKGQTRSEILEKYTFFSHVGNALALWRHTRPADFWKQWEGAHADEGTQVEPEPAAAPAKAKPEAH